MDQGLLISLILSNLPTLFALLILFYWVIVHWALEELRERDIPRGILNIMTGLSALILFLPFLALLISILATILGFVCTVVLFPTIFSVVNLAIIIANDGFLGLTKDITSGVLSLRVCSVILLWTSFQYIYMEFHPERKEYSAFEKYSKSSEAQDEFGLRIAFAREDYDNHPATNYMKSAKSAGHFGNLFFFSTTLALWVQIIFGFESIFFPFTSFLLFFIIDDWALLAYFKLHAAKAVTRTHRIRLHSATVSIAFLTLLSALEVNEASIIVAALLVCLFGSLSIKSMLAEERDLKELEHMGLN